MGSRTLFQVVRPEASNRTATAAVAKAAGERNHSTLVRAGNHLRFSRLAIAHRLGAGHSHRVNRIDRFSVLKLTRARRKMFKVAKTILAMIWFLKRKESSCM